MRTLAGWMSRQVVLVFGGERQYDVEGQIAFHFYHTGPNESEIDTLRDTIESVDRESPWQDPGTRYSGTHLESIRGFYHNVVTHNTRPVEIVVWFKLIIGDPYLRRAQVPAYEKYLYELARRLSARKLPGVHEIHTVVTTRRVSFLKAA